MAERLQRIVDSVRGAPSGVAKLTQKHPDDVVVTMALRSPLCKARKGGYRDMQDDELLTAFLRAVVPRMKIDPALVEDISFGTVLPPRVGYLVRAAALASGFPHTTCFQVVQRFCSSGLMAVGNVANQIRNDEIEIGLAVGFESMTANPDKSPEEFSPDLMGTEEVRDCLYPMGWTSENVSKDFGITRERMDELAAASQQRAGVAQSNGYFDSEIVPLDVWQKQAGSDQRTKVRVAKDDGIRGDSSAEKLGKIRAAFPQWGNGTTTGGNASQITDGAAAVLLMKRSKAEELGLEILGKHVCTSVAGLPPRIMGIGPAFAIPKALQTAGITKEDVDLFEVNEAFASMLGYCIDKYGLPHEKVNVNGGAIALGHPLGCTGARQVATGLAELRRREGKILVTSMCIGLGMGAAAVWVNEKA